MREVPVVIGKGKEKKEKKGKKKTRLGGTGPYQIQGPKKGLFKIYKFRTHATS